MLHNLYSDVFVSGTFVYVQKSNSKDQIALKFLPRKCEHASFCMYSFEIIIIIIINCRPF